jgi:UDP-N-acetyl-D-glucosamine dehydrogenase
MKIAVIGLGYVGLPLSLQFVASGVHVVGLDIDEEKIASLRDGKSYIKHVPDGAIASAVKEGLFEPSGDFARVKEVDAIIVCVPTPLNKHREPDMSYVLNTGRAIAPFLGGSAPVTDRGRNGTSVANRGRPVSLFAWAHDAEGYWNGSVVPKAHTSSGGGKSAVEEVPMLPDLLENGNGHPRVKLIVLESTTYPGTTDEDFRGVLEQGSGLKAGVGFHLAFSPEREDPGNPQSRVAVIPKVVGGYTSACRDRAVELYGKAIEKVVPVSSCRAAEATKLLENIFRSVNIALVNELKVVYEAMGIDIWEVIEAAKTKPFGFMPFYPGPGLGGHCIPIDPFYLTWKAREFGQHTRFIELAGEINASMPKHVVRKIGAALNEKSLALRHSRILLIGLAYKADVDDVRESPTFCLMDDLKSCGADVSYFDPWVPEVVPTREHAQWTGVKSVEWTREVISTFDCAVVCTAHTSVDYRELAGWIDCIVDTRNAMAEVETCGCRILKA